ncbi:MAG: FkbM family methyltransferase [Actinomycetota bacterium]|nr:FkbM family methyltransferase [Actinomycetota bacterium]
MNDFIRVACPKELHFLQPVVVEDLERVGNLADGGYVMTLPVITNIDSLLSLGLGENWSFESTFSQINRSARIEIYDNTVSLSFFVRKSLNGVVNLLLFRESGASVKARFSRLSNYFSFWYRNPRNKHHQVRISRETFDQALSRIPTDSVVGLKIDIEGSEWEILEQIVKHQSRFGFILIEIHDFDLHVQQLKNFLDQLSGRLVLSHLHANNFEGLGKNGFPRVFEITLLRDPAIRTPREYRKELPLDGMDTPNAKNRPDFVISFN